MHIARLVLRHVQFHVNFITEVFGDLRDTEPKPTRRPDHVSHSLQDVKPAAC